MVDCNILIHPEAINGFLEIDPDQSTKDTILQLIKCAEIPLTTKEDEELLDGQYVEVSDPNHNGPSYVLRIHDWFISYEPRGSYKLDKSVASLHNTLVLEIVNLANL